MCPQRSPLVPRPDEVHLWWIDLDRMAEADRVLSPRERARAARLRHARDRDHWMAAHLALRQILARYTSLPPAALRFAAGANGKPALAAGSPFRFSLSHAAERAVLAVTRQREVGVDLEPCHPDLPIRQELDALIATACSAAEARRLRSLSQEDRLCAFLRLWTLKEAYLKGLGLGLRWPPRDLEIAIDESGRAWVPQRAAPPRCGGAVSPSPWTLRLLDAGDGWIAALAVAGDEAEIVERHWPEPSPPPLERPPVTNIGKIS
jgi:4'-phosphopantetheinyl transferase